MNIKIDGFTITDAIWFHGKIGMVFGIDENGFTKINIGAGEGLNEIEDIKEIAIYGHNVNELVGIKITEHLKNAKISLEKKAISE